MWSLFDSLEIGKKSLDAQQAALQVTSNNIANVNTPGYHRQHAVMEPSPPQLTSIGPLGTGVEVSKVLSARDRFLELRISQADQNIGKLETTSTYINQAESVFGLTESGISDGITRFFNSFTGLASDPTSSPLRYAVVAAAENLAGAFRDGAQQLTEIRDNANAAIADTVREINILTESIAKLNVQITATEANGSEAGTLRDERSLALSRLSQAIDIRYFEADDGSLTVSAAAGTPLVTAGFSETLDAVATGPLGHFDVIAGVYNITSSINGGKLGGQLVVRDQLIPNYQNQLDVLAESIITRVNTVHAAGTDLQSPVSSPALNLFNPAAAVAGAAASFTVNSVVAGDPRYIAAGKSGAPGDNANALDLAALAFQKVLASGTETFSEAFGALQFKIGTDAQLAGAQLATGQATLIQLENSRDSISGVTLDDEAVDLLRFQRAYQAAARFISVIDELTEDLLNNLGA